MRILPILFSVTLFGSAFLSFSVQPILGKMLLPMVGGAPAGWIVAMAFFQLALLAGYGVSSFLERFSPWIHIASLFILYLIGIVFLPPSLPAISPDSASVQLSITVVKALCQAVFIPFLALTATTAGLQRVFAATTHPTAKDPYYLFVASNVGSFIGLFLYPFFLEPFSGLHQQAHFWQDVYAGVMCLILVSSLIAWYFRSAEKNVKTKVVHRAKVSRSDILKWIILAFVPCSLSMGVTTLITTDIAGMPLFWVIPLGLYLVTFILAFSSKRVISNDLLHFWHLVGVVALVISFGMGMGYQPGGAFVILALLGGMLLSIFFVIALSCHQALADSRPSADKLALFYFVVALGGGLAGILHAFVIPFVLPLVIEFPLVVILSLLLHPEFNKPKNKAIKSKDLNKILSYCIAMAIVSVVIATVLRYNHVSRFIYIPFLFVFTVSAMFVTIRPKHMFILGLVVLASSLLTRYPGDVIMFGRNFFGAHAVYEQPNHGVMVRYFAHGNTVHGLEIMNGTPAQKKNNSYYLQDGPIRHVLDITHARTFGVTGLGAGQLACFDKKLTVDFYEIDPAVEKVANEYFSYLKTCPVRAVVMGDARLKLEASNRKYDVLLQDAFTSDGVPIHLLTQEAFHIYRQHVTKNGIILFHVSNRYFDLAPSIAALAKADGLTAYKIFHIPKDGGNPFAMASRWVAIPQTKQGGAALLKRGWKVAEPGDDVWTDDRSTLLRSIMLKPAF